MKTLGKNIQLIEYNVKVKPEKQDLFFENWSLVSL